MRAAGEKCSIRDLRVESDSPAEVPDSLGL